MAGVIGQQQSACLADSKLWIQTKNINNKMLWIIIPFQLTTFFKSSSLAISSFNGCQDATMKPGTVVPAFNPSRDRQVSEFKDSQVYIVSSRPATTCGELVFKQTKKPNCKVYPLPWVFASEKGSDLFKL